MTTLGHLPSEVMHLILACVDDIGDIHQCSMVNKRFHDITNPKLWQSPTFTNLMEYSERWPVKAVLNCLKQSVDPARLGIHVRKLRVLCTDSEQQVLDFLAFTPLIEELAVESYVIGDDSLIRIARMCPHLQRLRLCQLEVTNDTINTVGRCCRSLVDLTLIACNRLTHLALQGLTHCRLERLDFILCDGLLTANTASALIPFDQLTFLRIHHHFLGITRPFIQRLLPLQADGSISLANLVQLSLTGRESLFGDTGVDDSVMVPFIQHHPHLKLLSLDCCQLGKDTLTAIAHYLPGLEILEICQKHGLSSRGLRQVIVACPCLVKVELYENGYLPESCFPEIGDLARQTGMLEQKDLGKIRQNSDWVTTDDDDVLLNTSTVGRIYIEENEYDVEDDFYRFIDDDDDGDGDDDDDDDDDDEDYDEMDEYVYDYDYDYNYEDDEDDDEYDEDDEDESGNEDEELADQ